MVICVVDDSVKSEVVRSESVRSSPPGAILPGLPNHGLECTCDKPEYNAGN